MQMCDHIGVMDELSCMYSLSIFYTIFLVYASVKLYRSTRFRSWNEKRVSRKNFPIARINKKKEEK